LKVLVRQRLANPAYSIGLIAYDAVIASDESKNGTVHPIRCQIKPGL